MAIRWQEPGALRSAVVGVVRGVARVYHRLRLSVFRKTRETRHALPSSCPVLPSAAPARWSSAGRAIRSSALQYGVCS
eukprot:scaffold93180_cov65-Phaeocystis_antarctica.AAC.2